MGRRVQRTGCSSRAAAALLERSEVPVISATRLTVRHRRTTAVDSLDLHLGNGVHALLGPNGAGKSTLLRVLATAAPAVEGELKLLGRDPRRPAERLEIRRRLGYLPRGSASAMPPGSRTCRTVRPSTRWNEPWIGSA
ncbi:ATP-binding cassette domain-containing protein [Streptomyces collinus]|uniref:ATP-binding cassette domain-containing protein n=1 Tax=Streptomyces collinus TaxID=42684 RepID=UPI00378A262B